MNKEQFGQFWDQLKAPLKVKWPAISEDDLLAIKGNLDAFGAVLQTRYGNDQKDDVVRWVQQRYCHWSGNYIGYQEAIAVV